MKCIIKSAKILLVYVLNFGEQMVTTLLPISI